MPSKVTVYDLLISCPGDAGDAINVIDDVVELFNQIYNASGRLIWQILYM